jgi:hypothetical protein
MYEKINTLNISDKQKDKIKNSLEKDRPVTIKIDPNEKGNDTLALTKTQIKKLQKGKPTYITLSKTQVKYNLKIEGGFLGMLASLIPRLLPMLTKTILPALGVGALTGLATTGVQKIIGDGLYLKKGGCICQVETDGKGLFLDPVNGSGLENYGEGLFLKRQGNVYDGKGLLLGENSPFKNIPILGLLL